MESARAAFADIDMDHTTSKPSTKATAPKRRRQIREANPSAFEPEQVELLRELEFSRGRQVPLEARNATLAILSGKEPDPTDARALARYIGNYNETANPTGCTRATLRRTANRAMAIYLRAAPR